MTKQILQPQGWSRPRGYSNGVSARGKFVCTAGVVGWNEEEVFEQKNIVDQFRQILINTKTILSEAGASPDDIVRMTCYVIDKHDYLNSLVDIGQVWRDEFGKAFPCMSVVEVSGLMEDDAKIEIETTAIIED